jgi:hypothetical protein
MPEQSVGYSGTLYEDRRQFYPSEQMVAQLYAPTTPFLSSVMAREAMGGGPMAANEDKSYKMFEHRQHWRYQECEVDGAPNSTFSGSPAGGPGDTAKIDIKNLEGIKLNSSLENVTFDVWDSGETTNKGRLFVHDVDTATGELTVKALGNPTAANEAVDSLSGDDKLYMISSAHGEGDTAPEAYGDELDVVWNSVQRERTAIEITEDLRRSALRGESDELARLRNEKQNEHKIKNSRNFLFGYRVGGIGGTAHRAGGTSDEDFLKDASGNVLHIQDQDGNRVTTTMGWISAMQRYAEDDDSAVKQNWFDRDVSSYDFYSFVEDTEKLAQYADKDVLTAYCAAPVMSFWSTKALSNTSDWQVEISDRQTSDLGFTFRVLETPHLAIRLIKEPTLRASPHAGKMMMPDLDYVGTAQFAPDTYESNIKTDDAPDIQKDEIRSWKGLTLRLLERHFIMDLNENNTLLG